MLAKAVFNELSIYGQVVVMGINSEPKGFEFDPPYEELGGENI